MYIKGMYMGYTPKAKAQKQITTELFVYIKSCEYGLSFRIIHPLRISYARTDRKSKKGKKERKKKNSFETD